jgi:arginine/serine-rich splicing factor 1/9
MSKRIFVGNLPFDIRGKELDDLFYKFGPITDIDIKTPHNPPAFAFLTYEDHRDAEDAVYRRDGYEFDGRRLRVELAKGKEIFGRDRDRDDKYSDRDKDNKYSDRSYSRDRYDEKPKRRRTDYGIIVSNLPKNCSWQDLKDYMRKCGDVVFADVDHRHCGNVEFSNEDDMKYAVEKFDNTEFNSSIIRLEYANSKYNNDKRSKSRSRSRSRSNQPSLINIDNNKSKSSSVTNINIVENIEFKEVEK